MSPDEIREALNQAGAIHRKDRPIIAAACSHAIDELNRLTRWKAEALTVMAGLQGLGPALGLPLGEQVTGKAAAEAAQRLADQNRRYANRIANNGHALQAVLDEHVTPRAQKLAAIHELAEMIADHFDDDWPHTPLCQSEPGCPLCLILAATKEP